MIAPWLTIVGLGEDGLAGLGDAAKQAIGKAPLVFGGARHLDLAAPAITGGRHVWLSPFDRSIAAILERRGQPTLVLASGDPFLYGVGATLSCHVDRREMIVFPAPSAFSLAASRLGWPLQDVATVSLHGRPVDLLRPLLQPGARILALTSDETGPADIASILVASGFGGSTLTVLEALGGPQERVTRHGAEGFSGSDIDPLNVCAIEVVAGPAARILPLASGLDDGLFEHDGQITKREIRAMTLSALSPRRGELLIDIGAGSGSIGIEWMLCDPSMRAIAIEPVAERVARIARNAKACGLPGLVIVEGRAPEALAGLPVPDAIFIGGGGSGVGVVEAALALLKPGGRIVANGVTLEMEAVLLALHARLGGGLTRIDIARASPVGTMTGWRPAMPVTQWAWTKSEGNLP